MIGTSPGGVGAGIHLATLTNNVKVSKAGIQAVQDADQRMVAEFLAILLRTFCIRRSTCALALAQDPSVVLTHSARVLLDSGQ